MGATYQLPGDKTITLKDRISQIEVARFSDRAPDLWHDMTDIYLDREKWDEVKRVTEEGDDDEREKVTKNAIMRQRLKRARVNFELTGHSVDALKALIDFCVAVTDSVSGFEDADGEPAVWKHMSDAEKQELYEMDVTSGRMVTIYLDCWAHKNGLIDLNDADD
jgi:hypothetical protein